MSAGFVWISACSETVVCGVLSLGQPIFVSAAPESLSLSLWCLDTLLPSMGVLPARFDREKGSSLLPDGCDGMETPSSRPHADWEHLWCPVQSCSLCSVIVRDL